jgi:hypothetical protein
MQFISADKSYISIGIKSWRFLADFFLFQMSLSEDAIRKLAEKELARAERNKQYQRKRFAEQKANELELIALREKIDIYEKCILRLLRKEPFSSVIDDLKDMIPEILTIVYDDDDDTIDFNPFSPTLSDCIDKDIAGSPEY